MRSCKRALVASSFLISALAVESTVNAADGTDASCAWRKLVRRSTSRGPTLTPRMRGTVDVSFRGSPAPRRISVALYASKDGVSLAGVRLSTKFVRPRAGRTVRVTFDTTVPFGDAGRFLVARVDDADEVAESDETNNVAAYGPFLNGEEYFPLETGTRWRYAGEKREGRRDPVAYVNSVLVAGEHVVPGGVVTQAVAQSDPHDSGPIVDYLQRDERGVLNWGSDDPTDDLTPLVAPFRTLYFPLSANYSVAAVSRHGLRLNDVDGDGRDERVSLSARIRFLGLEDVDLPVARFERCAHVRVRVGFSAVFSRTRARFGSFDSYDEWFAPGVGLVRETANLSGRPARSFFDETLTGFASASGGVGFVDGLTVGLVSTGGELDGPPPAVASDGSVALVAAARAPATNGPQGLIGIVVSSVGTPLREFQIADVPFDAADPQTPAVAYGAGVFVVAHRRDGEPLHLRAATADGAAPWGAGALDLPFSTGREGAFRVAFDGTDFLALVEGAEIPSGDPTVSVARVSAAGALLGTTRLADAFSPSGGVAAAWDGSSALCVWTVDTELRAVRVAADGQVLDAAPIRLATGAGVESHPAVAASPAGGWLVAWGDAGSARVKASLVSADGIAASAEGVVLDDAVAVDGRPEIALDGAEFLVVSQPSSPTGVRATRVSLDGVAVPQAEGGFGPPLAVSAVMPASMAPIVAQLADRALVLWRTFEAGADPSPSLSGAVVFPRREDLRRAVKSAR